VSLPSEEWRPVLGYEDLYDVSDRGSVRSSPMRSRGSGRLLKLKVTPAGYHRVMLYRDGQYKWHFVHRLVLTAFVRPPFGAEQTRHLNSDKRDNRVANLAWGTASENQMDNVRAGRHDKRRRTHCPRNHSYAEHGAWVAHSASGNAARRCLACYQNRRARSIRRPPRPIGPDDPRHGSERGYQHLCRCDACREAHRLTQVEWRAKRAAKAAVTNPAD